MQYNLYPPGREGLGFGRGNLATPGIQAEHRGNGTGFGILSENISSIPKYYVGSIVFSIIPNYIARKYPLPSLFRLNGEGKPWLKIAMLARTHQRRD